MSSRKPRYYIETDDGDSRHRDDIGIELPGPQQARKLAIEALPDMARERMPDGDRRVFTVAVRDEDNQIVYTGILSFVGQWHIERP